MTTQTVTYTDAGVTLKGFLAYNDKQTGKRPGILVMPEAFGLGKNAKNRAKRLARTRLRGARRRPVRRR